jgi:hypothetical protein
MNPRDRRLRLRKSTVRGLGPSHAAEARGGTVKFDKKTTTDDTNCFLTYNQVGCESYLCNNSEGFTCDLAWTCNTCHETGGDCDTLNVTCDQTQCTCQTTEPQY